MLRQMLRQCGTKFLRAALESKDADETLRYEIRAELKRRKPSNTHEFEVTRTVLVEYECVGENVGSSTEPYEPAHVEIDGATLDGVNIELTEDELAICEREILTEWENDS